MILRNRGAKTPLLSVDLTPARVALNLRERGAVFPCKWCSVAEIYTENLKATDQMKWVQSINNIQWSINEYIEKEIITQ